MTPVHPADGVLRALLDRELSLPQTIRARLHLLFCAGCGERLEALRARGEAVASLIRSSAPEVDTADAWARFLVRSGHDESRLHRRLPSWTAPAVTTAAMIAVAVFALFTPDGGPPDDGELFAMVSAARERSDEVVRDACCQDHDGGERPDDGLLTLSLPGERVAVVIIYEDVDASGTFTPGDIVRYVSRRPAP